MSKAFEKSRSATSTCLLFSKEVTKPWTVVNSWVSQELPEQNPWFTLVKILFSKWLRRWWHIMCFKILYGTEVREMGL